MIKLYHDLEKERKEEKELIEAIRKSKKNLSGVFDKAYFIEKIHESLEEGKSATIKLDEKTEGYNILSGSPPRLVIQDNNEVIDVKAFFEKLGMMMTEKSGEYLLTIKKTSDKFDMKLKIDHDRTIDLSTLSKDKKFSGIRSYYHIKKDDI